MCTDGVPSKPDTGNVLAGVSSAGQLVGSVRHFSDPGPLRLLVGSPGLLAVDSRGQLASSVSGGGMSSDFGNVWAFVEIWGSFG